MAFEFSEEHRLFKDMVDRMLLERYGFEQRRAFASTPIGWSRDNWRRFAQIGLLGAAFPEEYGGMNGSGLLSPIMEAFGRALVLEPYLATVVLAGNAILLGGSERQKEAILPRIASGDLLMAFAHGEAQARYDLADVATHARRVDGGWILNGRKYMAIHGDCAEQLVVSARIAGDPRAREGIALFIVDATAAGVETNGYATQDGLRAANIVLEDVHVDDGACVGAPGDAFPTIRHVTDKAIAATAAEAIGVMEDMLAMTVDYMKTRRQFGVEIGSFQVLQHRAVDMLIAADQSRSMALYAVAMSDNPNADERGKAMSAAKAQIGKSLRFVAQQAIQLHGGIGLTMEYKVGHAFLRATAIEFLFGDAEHHLTLLARAGGLISADDERLSE